MTENIFDPLLLKLFFAGFGIAISAAVIGVFVLWKKMAYFSDAISHATIFGLAFAAIIEVMPIYGVIFCSIIFCLLMFYLAHQKFYSNDVVIGISSYILLALGLILIAVFSVNVNLHLYLFGDLLVINNSDIFLIYFSLIIVLIAVFCGYKKMLMICINDDLAKISGIKTDKIQLQFLLLLAFLVAILVKIIGILLITSMLVMPAAIARIYAKNPLAMIILSIIFAIISVALGIISAFIFDLPIAAAIISLMAVILIFSFLFKKWIC